MRALDIKILRDLGRLWAQSLAIALVMACGVATLILSAGVHGSLLQTREIYYDRFRFGDVFASAVRAPASLVATIARIDGVVAAEPRIEHAALLDIAGFREPATGRLISLPETGDIAVNALENRAPFNLNSSCFSRPAQWPRLSAIAEPFRLSAQDCKAPSLAVRQ